MSIRSIFLDEIRKIIDMTIDKEVDVTTYQVNVKDNNRLSVEHNLIVEQLS